MRGKPIRKNDPKLMGLPYLEAMPATMTLADAPIRVPLPPRQAPRARAHQVGSIGIPEICPMVCSKGIIVATNGMLSTKAEAIADSHKTSKPVCAGLAPVSPRAWTAINSITPVSTNPPTRTNRPAKKKTVGHSMFKKISSGLSLVISIKTAAPKRATVADSRCRGWCSINPAMVNPSPSRD